MIYVLVYGAYFLGLLIGFLIAKNNSVSARYVKSALQHYDELLQQRDELREALAEQKRLYFSLFDEETSCMYCEAKIRRGSAIILCKECVENTEI